MKLVSTTDFVIEHATKVMAENDPRDASKTAIVIANSYKQIASYAILLKKKLTLDMFHPCNVSGKRILEPKKKYKGGGNAIGSVNGGLIHIEDHKDFAIFHNIESLLTFFGELKPAITLTKTAIKEIGL